MEAKTNKKRDPLSNLTPSDLKMIDAIRTTDAKVVKATEARNAALAAAYRAKLHDRAGYNNFGKWAVEAAAARGFTLSKSAAYNAAKIADGRDAYGDLASDLPDTVLLRMVESGPALDAGEETLSEFAGEVLSKGGTVEAVKTVTQGDADDRDPLDKVVDDFARRVVRLCRNDAKAAYAAAASAHDEIERLLVEAAKAK